MNAEDIVTLFPIVLYLTFTIVTFCRDAPVVRLLTMGLTYPLLVEYQWSTLTKTFLTVLGFYHLVFAFIEVMTMKVNRK